MTKWAILGGFLAVAAVLTAIILIIRHKIRAASREVFGSPDMISNLSKLEKETQDRPRSLSGCDSILLPDIIKDFPDFDSTLAKSSLRDNLKEHIVSEKPPVIHNVVIYRYLRSQSQRTIVFQAAAACWRNGEKQQKRFKVHYSNIVTGDGTAVAANCPNCGAALGYGQTVCSYCNSRVVNVLGNTWKFTRLTED